MILQQLVAALQPWQSAYSDSKVIPAVVTSVHLVALLFGGGLAVAADRATLRVGRNGVVDGAVQLAELRAVHRPVLIALVALFASGILLTAADLETFLSAPVFWVKLGFVGLLLLNGFMMTRTEKALGAGGNETALWSRLRIISVLSLILWIATTLVGVVLTNYA